MTYTFNANIQNQLAQSLKELHHKNETLIVPNAWDAVSAKIFENAGFSAIATTSSGISWVCGAQDGEQIDPDLMQTVVTRIAQNVKIPVTADLEGCYYHNDNQQLQKFIQNLIKGGVVGLNIEDTHAVDKGLNPLNHQIEKIKLIKDTALQMGVDLFVNARTDAMTLEKDLSEKIEFCINRAKAFKEAGADGIFIPFVEDLKTVESLKAHIDLPLNILYEENLPVKELQKLGVNRISVGSKPILATMKTLQELSENMLNTTNWSSLSIDKPGYRDANGWFAK